MRHESVQLLARAPLFKGLPPAELERLAAVLEVVEAGPGEILFHEGDIGQQFYIILEGQVEVLKALGTPDERLIARRGVGEFVGDLSFLSPDKQRTATVRTPGGARLWQITHREPDQILHRHPATAYEMMNVLAARLTTAHNAALHDLHEKNAQLQAAYDNLKAAQAQLIEKEKLERELQVGYEIQMSILPQTLPTHAAYEFGALIVPARTVGGDFYDVIPLDPAGGRFGVVIGDVSDKGVPSAIFMAQTHALLFAEASQGRSPREVLERLNRHLLRMNATGQFVTTIYGILDTTSGEFSYARCAHEVPILAGRDAAAQQVAAGRGHPLGVMDEALIDEQTLQFKPGDLLLLFTDGMPDVHDETQQTFGLDRLLAATDALKESHAQEICERLFTAARGFRGNAPQFDDITLVAIRHTPAID